MQSHLAQLPASDNPGVIVAGDLDAASEAAGLQRPDDADSEAGREWLTALTTVVDYPVFVPLPGQLMMAFGQEGGDELGWDLTDVQTFTDSTAPPRTTLLVTGDFDDDTISEDLDDLGEGVFSAGAGEDYFITLTETTAVRPAGAPLRLGHRDGAIVVDSEEQAVRAWLEDQDRSTLAADDAVMGLAEALDAQDVYAAAVRTHAGALEPDPGMTAAQAAQLREHWQEWAITEPFDAMGFGWAMANDEHVVALAYHFADTDSAERAVDQVRQVWTQGTNLAGHQLSQMFTVQDVEQDGQIVAATLHLGAEGQPQHVFDMLQRQEVTVGYLEP